MGLGTLVTTPLYILTAENVYAININVQQLLTYKIYFKLENNFNNFNLYLNIIRLS